MWRPNSNNLKNLPNLAKIWVAHTKDQPRILEAVPKLQFMDKRVWTCRKVKPIRNLPQNKKLKATWPCQICGKAEIANSWCHNPLILKSPKVKVGVLKQGPVLLRRQEGRINPSVKAQASMPHLLDLPPPQAQRNSKRSRKNLSLAKYLTVYLIMHPQN